MQSPGAGAEEGDHEPPHRLSAAQHAKAGDGWALDRRRTGHSIRDALAENAFPNPDDGDPAGGRPGSPFAYGADGRSRDRKSVGEGKSVAVRVGLGGRRIIKK